MTPSKQDLAGLFSGQGANLGLDAKASSTLIANLNATTVPMCVGDPFAAEELATDDFKLVYFGLDASGSMDVVENDVREIFNEVIMPGLLGGAASQVGAIRYGGLKFNSSVSKLWGAGFQRLTASFPKLTPSEYSAGGSTALHQGVLDAVTAVTAQALQIANTTGTNPEVVLAFLSDGANNCAPRDYDPVFQVLSKLDRELFTLVFYGFETEEKVNFAEIARNLGFRDIRESKAKPGETLDERRRRFRHDMKVFSQQLVKRASTSQVGKSKGSVAGGSTGFWDQP